MRYVKRTVDVIRLDNLKVEPDIVTIDTEGFDYNVLLGLEETIAGKRPYIFMEYNPGTQEKVAAFCAERDYAVFRYEADGDLFHPLETRQGPLHRNETGNRNVLLTPVEKVDMLPRS